VFTGLVVECPPVTLLRGNFTAVKALAQVPVWMPAGS
jgi:hypothetical protein